MTDNSEIIIYEGAGDQPSIEVRVESETVWLTQAQLVNLSGPDHLAWLSGKISNSHQIPPMGHRAPA